MRPIPPAILALSMSLVCLPAQRGIGALYTRNLAGDKFTPLPAGSTNVGETLNAKTRRIYEDVIGVVRLPDGHYIVSANRAKGSSLGSPHKFFELGPDGRYLAGFDQPAVTATKISGLQDLAWDRRSDPGSRVWSGFGKLLFAFDWQAGVFELQPVTGGKLLTGFQGVQVQGAAIASIGGQDVLVTSDAPNPAPGFAGSPINYHLLNAANPLAKFRAGTPDISDADQLGTPPDFGKFGAAYDPISESIWWAVDLQHSNPNPNQSPLRFIEMDQNGNLTGQVYQGNRSIGGAANGCEIYINEDGEVVMVYVAYDLSVDGFEKIVEVYGRFRYGDSCGGEISFVGEPFIDSPELRIRLSGAPANFLDAAIILRGRPVELPGVMIPGITNCPVLMDLGSFRAVATLPLQAGAATFIQRIPGFPSLLDQELAFQWLLPTAPYVLPLDLSPAGSLRIGSNQ
ncbi:MAG: hypothetical protein ACYTG5_20255 [Planctomycetota bacterium]|jgi:hypothetical protein